MPKLYPGGITIGTNLKIQQPNPVADYMVVSAKTDLTNTTILPNQFTGMTTFVVEDQNTYVLKNTGWQILGGGSTFTGGTVSGATTFTGGLSANTISATTISATTYNGYVPYNSSNPSGYITSSDDVYVTGGTINHNNNWITLNRHNASSIYITDFASIIETNRNEIVDGDNNYRNNLFKGATYKINDCDSSLYNNRENDYTTVYLKAIESNVLSDTGIGVFYTPKYINPNGWDIWSPLSVLQVTVTSGVFDSNELITGNNGSTGTIFGDITSGLFYTLSEWKSDTTITGDVSGAQANIDLITIKQYSKNQIIFWGGTAWVATDDFSVGGSVDIFNLDTNNFPIQQMLPLSGSNIQYYNISYDEIKYDIVTDKITYRKDKNNNIVSTSTDNIAYWIDNSGLNNPIKAFKWGHDFTYSDETGIGNQKIVNSYNENINFRGTAQYNIEMDNLSYQTNIYGEGVSTFQSNLYLSNSYQNNIKLVDTSRQNYINFNNQSSQSNLNIIGSSNQNYINFNNQSSQSNVTITNDSIQEYVIFENFAAQNNAKIIDSIQNRVKLYNYVFDRGFANVDETDKIYTNTLVTDNSAPQVIGIKNNELVEVDLGQKFVPYTGATQNVDLNTYSLTANSLTTNTSIFLQDVIDTGKYVRIFYEEGNFICEDVTNNIGKFNVNGFEFTMTNPNGNNSIISNSFISNQRTYYLPDADGTFALLSDITSFSGGTVTGLTVNGILTVTGNTSLRGLTATTISATTYNGYVPLSATPITVVSGSSLFSTAFTGTGLNASAVTNSIFFGVDAGRGATNANGSNFFGQSAGFAGSGASFSNFIGYQAGQNAFNASGSVFMGSSAGKNASTSTGSNFLGPLAGLDATNAQYSNFLGYEAGRNASGASGSNFFGLTAGQNAINANGSNFFGQGAGFQASVASSSNFLGPNAGSNAINANNSNFFGTNSGVLASGASNSNFFGNFAGYSATSASHSNFMGFEAGRNASAATNSTFIGRRAGYTSATSETVGSNNIIIGTNISLPSATTNSLNLGGVLFGTGTYSTTTGNPSIVPNSVGRIGIGVVNPTQTLHVSGNTFLEGFLIVSGTTAAIGDSNAGSLLNLQQTWNTTGAPTAVKLNVTDTASNTNSLLMDLQVTGTSRFSVNKNGGVSATTFNGYIPMNAAESFLPLSGGTVDGSIFIKSFGAALTISTPNYSSGSQGNILYFTDITGTTNGKAINSRSNGGGSSGALILQQQDNGFVGVNTSSVNPTLNYNLDVNGSFGAISVSATTVSATTYNGYEPADMRTDLTERRLGYTVSTDFLSPVTALLSPFGLGTFNGGTLATVANQVDNQHPGVQQLQSATGATNTGGYITTHVQTNAFSFVFMDGLQTNLIFKLPPTTTNNYIRIGFFTGSLTVTLPTNGNYFEISGTTLVGITRLSSVQSATSSFTLTANTWYHTRLKESIVGGINTVTFSVYDMDGNVLYDQSSITNINTASTRALTVLGANTVSNAALTPIIYLDYLGLTFPPMIRGALD